MGVHQIDIIDFATARRDRGLPVDVQAFSLMSRYRKETASIIDSILGGGNSGGNNGGNSGSESQASSNSNDFGALFHSDPSFHTSVDDLLHLTEASNDSGSGNNGGDSSSNLSDFTGVGHADFGFSAPTVLGVSSNNESWNQSESTGGSGGGHGLLQGLL